MTKEKNESSQSAQDGKSKELSDEQLKGASGGTTYAAVWMSDKKKKENLPKAGHDDKQTGRVK